MDPGEHDAAGDNVASSWIPTRKDHGHAQSMAPTTFMTIRRLGPGIFDLTLAMTWLCPSVPPPMTGACFAHF